MVAADAVVCSPVYGPSKASNETPVSLGDGSLHETPNRLRSSTNLNRYGRAVTDTAARCGYSRCRAELPAPGPQGGRRRSFCRDTRWEGGRTCAQMARGERDALDALGLDG